MWSTDIWTEEKTEQQEYERKGNTKLKLRGYCRESPGTSKKKEYEENDENVTRRREPLKSVQYKKKRAWHSNYV